MSSLCEVPGEAESLDLLQEPYPRIPTSRRITIEDQGPNARKRNAARRLS